MIEAHMTGEPSLAPVEASAPSATASDALPFSVWLLFGLGVVSCATWIGAVLLDLWAPTSNLAPIWLWHGLHAALILAVPALILLFGRSPHMPARRHPRAFFAVMALLALIIALPALLPIAAPPSPDLVSLPLRVPTLSLGVALAAVDPLVIERWRRSDSHDSSIALAAGLGFGVTAIIAVCHRLLHQRHTASHGATPCADGGGLGCGSLIGRMMVAGCGGGSLFALPGLFGALLGYAIGAWVARADSW